MKFSLPALIFAVVGGAAGQLLMKAGLLNVPTDSPKVILLTLLESPSSSLLLFCGLTFYAAAMPAWIIALKRYELSFAYPMISLGYLIVYLGAYYWPGMEESITWQKTTGLSLIVVGVALTAQTSMPGKQVRYEKINQA